MRPACLLPGPNGLPQARLAIVFCAVAMSVHLARPAACQESSVPDTSGASADDSATRDADTPESGQADSRVDFVAEVQPILAAHCYGCHDAKEHSSGLRLDSREHAQRGGDSGLPVLGATPETNELWARVSSDDRAYRMPKNAPPLSEAELEILERWVDQGAVWDVPPEPPPPAFYVRWADEIDSLVARYEFEFDYALPYLIGMLAFYVVLLLVLRCQKAYRAGRPWATRRLAPVGQFCDRVRRRELVLLLMLSLTAFGLVVARGHAINVERQLAALRPPAGDVDNRWSGTPYGFPPRPVRHRGQTNQITRTYYRGNCERNPQLFNGGNYLTAVFRVNLCDAKRRPLALGDSVPSEELYVRIEIERAPGTTDLLFSDDMIKSVLFVKEFPEHPDQKLKEEPARLETLETGHRWASFVPIGVAPETGELNGVIYIYTGQLDQDMLSGTLQYGVQYELRFADGAISPDSDLWMDSFGNVAFAPPAPPDKLPYSEWFDEHPIPAITGENSQDPKLLGVDEYVKKGLIAPVPETKGAGEAPPAEAQPPESREDE